MSCDELIETWDRHEPIKAVDLGGMGDDYEMAIQSLLMELVRDMRNKLPPKDDKEAWRTWGNETISRLDKEWGFSGAQVGAAKVTAFQYLKYGYDEMLATAPADRIITIVKPQGKVGA